MDDGGRHAGGGERDARGRPQPLAEDVRELGIHGDGVGAAGVQPPLQRPAVLLGGGVLHGEGPVAVQVHVAHHLRAAHGGGELQDRGAVVAPRVLRAPAFDHAQGAVGGEGPAERLVPVPRLVHPLREHQLRRAPGRERPLGGKLHHAAQVPGAVVARRAEVPHPLRVRLLDGPHADAAQGDGGRAAARLPQHQAGGAGQLVRLHRAAHQHEEARVRLQEAGRAVRAHGPAGQDACPLDAEGEAVRARQACAVHGREIGGDGDGVGGARAQRRGGGKAQRHRVAPLRPPLHGGVDAEERLRVHRLVQPAGDGPVKGDGDHGLRLRNGLRRRAQDAQHRRILRRGFGAQHEYARKAGERDQRAGEAEHGGGARGGGTPAERTGKIACRPADQQKNSSHSEGTEDTEDCLWTPLFPLGDDSFWFIADMVASQPAGRAARPAVVPSQASATVSIAGSSADTFPAVYALHPADASTCRASFAGACLAVELAGAPVRPPDRDVASTVRAVRKSTGSRGGDR
jgi:hypothetical protein